MPHFKGTVAVLFAALALAGAVSAEAQVVPAATDRRPSITLGGLGSVFQPEYAGGYFGQTAPTPLIGVAAYADVRFARWVQVEGEARWLAFNAYRGFTEENYLIGPRVPIYRFGRFTPYAKILFGRGNGDFLRGSTAVIAYGGGVDYRVSKRMNLRAFDFEYQQWHTAPTTLFPYGGSAGVGFNF